MHACMHARTHTHGPRYDPSPVYFTAVLYLVIIEVDANSLEEYALLYCFTVLYYSTFLLQYFTAALYYGTLLQHFAAVTVSIWPIMKHKTPSLTPLTGYEKCFK